MKSVMIRVEQNTAAFTAAVIFALIALLASAFLWGNTLGEGWDRMIISAPIAAFFMGWLCWRCLAASRSSLRAVLAGALTAILTYPSTWYCFLLSAWLFGETDWSGQPVVSPFSSEAASAVVVLSAAGAMLTGWFIVPLGAATGYLIARLQGRSAE